MRISNIFYIASLFFSLNARIVEHAKLEDVLQYIDPAKQEQLIVFCDLDNTLIKPTGYMGSDAWAKDIRKKYLDMGYTYMQAFDKAVQEFIPICNEMEVMLVENTTAHTIASIKKHVRIYGLTARSKHLIHATQRQLTSLDLSFSEYQNTTLFGKDEAVYEKGIFFCGSSTAKGEVIKQLVAHEEKKSIIIFIDDDYHHIENVNTMAEKMDIPCIAIYYNQSIS